MSAAAYLNILQQSWKDGVLTTEEYSMLLALQQRFGLSEEQAGDLERQVLGMTKEEALVHGLNQSAPPVPATGMRPGTGAPAGGTLSGGETILGGPRGSREGPTLAAGAVIRSRYEVLQQLGRGGMGQVLKVKDRHLDEVRAMKLLAPEHVSSPELMDRLRREVRLCQRLRHPHIVQVFDYDEDPVAGLAYFTMELLEGSSLGDWLSRRRGELLTLAQVELISSGLIEALEYAHEKGVIHLDLKPDNIMVSEDLSDLRVLDFGIGRALESEGLMTGLSGAGTPYYMAPEQELGSADVDSRADVYALGAILYELLTGHPPRGNFRPPPGAPPPTGGPPQPPGWGEAGVAALSPRPDDRPALRDLLRRSTVDLSTLEIEYRETPRGQRVDLLRGRAREGASSWEDAAASGERFAQFLMGRCQQEGIVHPKDPQRAAEFYRMAAEQGLGLAQNNLGNAYYYGEGVPEDDAEAAKWWRLAADQGVASAQCALGVAYYDGRGVPQDHAEAAKWWRLAADQGHAGAQRRLGVAYHTGEGVPEDDAEAAKWWRLAADQGHAEASERLGLTNRNSEGVPQDDAEADGDTWLGCGFLLLIAIGLFYGVKVFFF